MRRSTIVWLIIATSLILIGIVIFTGVMTMLKWDFSKLSTVKYETNQYTVSESFTNISVITDTANVTFVPTEESECTIVCNEESNAKHNVSVANDTLSITLNDTRKWYEYIGISIGNATAITVYVPHSNYGDLSIIGSTGDVYLEKDFKFNSIDVKLSTGDIVSRSHADNSVKLKANTGSIFVEDISCADLELTVTTGTINGKNIECSGDLSINTSTGRSNLSNTSCNNLTSIGNTGDFHLNTVIASEKVHIKRSTGDITLANCDAAELLIITYTGDVSGTLLTEKTFIAITETGNVSVPEPISGGKCQVKTRTGDINFTIA